MKIQNRVNQIDIDELNRDFIFIFYSYPKNF